MIEDIENSTMWGKFEFALNALTNGVKQISVDVMRREQQRIARLPIYVSKSFASQISTGTTDVVEFDIGPQPGRQWIVRLLTAFPSPLVIPANPAGPTEIVVPNPAAGVDWTQTVPVGETWTVTGWRGTFTASAVAGARTVSFLMDGNPNTNNIATITAPSSVAASSVTVFQGNNGIPELPGARGGAQPLYFPLNQQIESGGRLRTVTSGILGGDQWSAISIDIIRTITTTLPGTVTWYVGQRMPTLGSAGGQPPSTMARWQFTTIPTFQSFTSDIIAILPGERLIAGLTGLTAGNVIALTAAFNDQPLSSGRGPVSVTI